MEYLPTTSYTLKWSTLFPLGKERQKDKNGVFWKISKMKFLLII